MCATAGPEREDAPASQSSASTLLSGKVSLKIVPTTATLGPGAAGGGAARAEAASASSLANATGPSARTTVSGGMRAVM